MSLSHAQVIYRAAIAAVSPPSLVARAMNFAPQTGILKINDHRYQVHKNVRLVGFGKAVLGMATAVEKLLGENVVTGLVSVPRGILDTAANMFPEYLPHRNSNIEFMEGAAHNQPDEPAHSTAKRILSLVKEAGEGDVVIVVISGGGSALFPCPVEGVSLEEKALAIKLLSNAGATINELNMFRKAVSQTKGGKLAEAAYPAKVVALVLSDVIGDPLDIIASGPTVPNTVTKVQVLQLLEKYGLLNKLPQSILSHLRADQDTSGHAQFPMRNGCYGNTQNVIIGNNQTATQSAYSAAINIGYSCHVWSHRVQGEARDIGTVYANIAQSLITGQGSSAKLLEEERIKVLLSSMPSSMQEDLRTLLRELDQLSSRPLCLISAGEPTVTVKEGATGSGGRSQELALAYTLEMEKLTSLSGSVFPHSSVLACVGTDGQDGPGNDAAGAMVDKDTARLAKEDGLSPDRYLKNNDSHTFYSKLSSGKYLIQTGLTGTNVMDIHLLLVE